MRIFEIDDEAGALEFVKNVYCKDKWKYGQLANSSRDYDQGHWKVSLGLGNTLPLTFDHDQMPFIKKHPAINAMWTHLKSLLGEDTILVRAYINGYTYGTDGYAHRDDQWINERYGKDALSETCIFYLNDEWHHDWGGETVVYNEDLEIENAILPKKNRLIVFDSNKLHAARPLSRCYTGVRQVLVMKTASSIVNESRVQFIRDMYSDDTKFERLYNIAVTVFNNDVADNITQAAMYCDIYKDVDTSRPVMKEHLGLYPEELIGTYHELHHEKNILIDELEKNEDITSIVKRDLAILHYAVLFEDNGSKEDMDRLIEIVKANDA